MIKNKLDYKLINLAIIAFIITLFYLTINFWLTIIQMILKIVIPFVVAFAIAHALYPLLKKMEARKIPKVVSIFIIVILIIGLFTILISLVLPLIFEQTLGLLSGILKFVNDISNQYDLNLGAFQHSLNDTINIIVKSIGEYLSNGVFAFVSRSLSFFSIIIIIAFVSIYILVDMSKIRSKTKQYFVRKNKKTFAYLKILDYEISQYFYGLGQFITWQFFEYSIVYYIIGHPHFLLIAFLAAITTFIPYLGAIITNLIALITAFAISTNLFVLTLFAIILLSSIDSYIVSPKIFGGTNKIHPLLTIFAVFAGGILGGISGIIIAIPTTIIIVSTLKYYKTDIYAIIDYRK